MGGKINPKLLAITAVVLVALVAFAAFSVHRMQLATRLVATAADEVPGDAKLVSYAHQVAVPAFARTCARCHGADMKGSVAAGAPNLTDKVWLYDQGNVSDIERTILYGVRSGHSKSRNITDMPAVGRIGVLKDPEIRDVVEYVEQLSHQPHDAVAAARGEALFKDRGNCFDCHAPDGTGNPDYGSTDLTANVWTYGGARLPAGPPVGTFGADPRATPPGPTPGRSGAARRRGHVCGRPLRVGACRQTRRAGVVGRNVGNPIG